ncbi:hypothetical protein [Engelhardtia mirabilis]|uniref:Glycosyltransferase RgtA/B/C/D-like domain-containing protein n=1 Tax=Engelhardtia mirabilis TaxID=2528011 RepID=A0A518BRQ5_9BACT|nr:hypothetical protein Pla133_47850 [Planctomycetes bacterium Pla133]QDV03990.1 hypothetical protein Pla86_47830 [Planctomycetes bacterium Pla86]
MPRVLSSPRVATIAAAAVTVALLAAVAGDATPLLRGPAPWPPEWQWGLREATPEHGVAGAVLWSVVLIALVVGAGSARLDRAGRLVVTGWLLAASIGSLGLTTSLAAMEDGHGAVDVLVRRTLSKGFTSYHTVAVSEDARDVGVFLARFDELLPDLPTHARAHPPGPIVFYRALHGLVTSSPGLERALVARGEAGGYREPLRGPPTQDAHVASALLGALVLLAVASLAPLACAAFARALGASRSRATGIGALTALVPGLALMTPTFDQLLVPLLLTVVALLATATAPGRNAAQRWALATSAGALAGVCVFCSFGAPIFMAVGGLMAAASSLARGSRPGRDVAAPMALAAAVCALGFFVPMLVGYDPIAGLRAALGVHAEEFTSRRSYGAWVLFNLWDLFVFAGPPLGVLLIARLTRREGGLAASVAWTLAISLLLLDLSGVVRGEAGRIWVPLMPYVLVAALIDDERAERNPAAECARPVWVVLAALLALTCIVLRWHWRLP